MKPTDAFRRDWPMYYGNTWMKHRVFGPCHIMVNPHGEFSTNTNGNVRRVKAADLECWWPRSGSYNSRLGAVYIARKAARNMRKSATSGDHYNVTYGAIPRGTDPLSLMVRGPNYVSVEAAMEMLELEVTSAVAVTRDIILAQSTDKVEVVFRGNPTGTLTEEGFEPYVQLDPLSKRAYVKLMQEGIA